MGCWYTLVLRYGSNKFYLAPRASISIVEERDLETLATDKACATCGSTVDRTWKLKAIFDGGCDLISAWSLYRSLEAFLAAACDSDLTVERTVCRETPLVYKVTKTKLEMTDTDWQRSGRPRVLSMKIELELKAWVEEGEGAVLVGA